MSWKYYDILEIPKGSSKEDIKKAYKKKAIETHPDKGGDAEKFKEVNSAYSILNDDNKRVEYDQLGDERFNASGNGDGGMHVDPNDIFSQFFGNGFNFHFHQNHGRREEVNTKRSDHHHVIRIKLDDVFTGLKRNIRVILQKTCQKCNERCYSCQGRGQITEMHRMGFFTQMIARPCGSCNGIGVIVKGKTGCSECNGSGKYNVEKTIEINIPAGVENGYHIKYTGYGEQPLKPNEIAGDLIIEIHVLPHDTFTRNGNNLTMKIPISFKMSIIGTKINIPHFGGTFQFNTNDVGIIQNTKNYMIKNRGMPINNTEELGNMILTFDIQYPNVKITQENTKRIDELFNDIGL